MAKPTDGANLGAWTTWDDGARFRKIRRRRNEYRGYVLIVTPTLLGDWALVIRWGRIGATNLREIVEEFPTQAAAFGAFHAQAARRRRRGYKRVG